MHRHSQNYYTLLTEYSPTGNNPNNSPNGVVKILTTVPSSTKLRTKPKLGKEWRDTSNGHTRHQYPMLEKGQTTVKSARLMI